MSIILLNRLMVKKSVTKINLVKIINIRIV